MRLSSRAVPLLVLGLLLSACEPTPTSPAVEADGLELALTAEPARGERYVPLLHRLFGEAVRKVETERGAEAARQLAAEHLRLSRAAGEARAAGDTATARRLAQEAQGVAARVVARVFPGAAERVLGLVGTQLEKLTARIAAAEAEGRDVARAKELAQRVRRLAAAARAELGSERAVAALLHATQAADLLASLK